MNLTGVGSSPGTLDAYGLNALQPAGSVAALTSASGTNQTAPLTGGAASGTDSVENSPPAQMLSKLQELQAKDPAKFKQVLSDIASKLQTLSQQEGQSSGGQSLSKLADRFQTAANTGDLSALQPHGQHHHHSHGSSGAYGQASSPDQQALQQVLGNGGGVSSPASGIKSQLSSIFAEINTALAQ